MLQTPLHHWHQEHQGRMVDFAGWSMPIQYATIVEEHQAVRQAAGLFDISHMGRLFFRGADAAEFLNAVTTIDISQLSPGRIRYALATNEEGGIRDDILVYRLNDGFLVVVNASNREKIVADWSAVLQSRGGDVELDDQTLQQAMLALQGPAALASIEQLIPGCGQLKYYRCQVADVQGQPVLVSRTGYTGEDGFELIADNELLVQLWQQLAGKLPAVQGRACGLGCRDTLRLEAAMPLYGHELSETIDPLSAGLEFAVHLNKPDFRGKAALEKLQQSGLVQIRVGLELSGRKIPREHALIKTTTGDVIGEVTSGTFSPTLQKPIAMGFVPPAFSAINTDLLIDIRGTACPARVTALPFYQRPKSR